MRDLNTHLAGVMRMQNVYIAPVARGAVSAGVQRTAEAPDARISRAGKESRGRAVAAQQLPVQGGDGDAKASAARLAEKYDIEWMERELDKDLQKKLMEDLDKKLMEDLDKKLMEDLDKKLMEDLDKKLMEDLDKKLMEDVWLYSMNEYVPKEGTCAVVRFYP